MCLACPAPAPAHAHLLACMPPLLMSALVLLHPPAAHLAPPAPHTHTPNAAGDEAGGAEDEDEVMQDLVDEAGDASELEDELDDELCDEGVEVAAASAGSKRKRASSKVGGWAWVRVSGWGCCVQTAGCVVGRV